MLNGGSILKVGQRFNPFRLFTGIFIPEVVCEIKDISVGAKLVYGRLCRYAGERGEAWPAIETLAENLGISESTCRRCVQELEDYKLIEREFRTGHSTVYYFLGHDCFNMKPGEQAKAVLINEGCQVETPVNTGGVKLTGEGCQVDTQKLVIEESHITTPTPSKLQTVAEEIHKRHPKHRRDCGPREVQKHLKAILRHGKKTSTKPWPGDGPVLDWLNDNHAKWCESIEWTKEDGQFAKGLSNWLAPTMGRYKQPALENYKKPVHFV